MKSYSIVDSIISKSQKELDEYSEYSIISGARMSSILKSLKSECGDDMPANGKRLYGVNEIAVERDIYAEDMIM
jgi:hypothetical protein